jgi:hypothetical protein
MSAKSEYIEQIADLPFTHNYESELRFRALYALVTPDVIDRA